MSCRLPTHPHISGRCRHNLTLVADRMNIPPFFNLCHGI